MIKLPGGPSPGAAAALYSYNPFGNTISATGSHANINPLRYRGYYYDTETGLYYLYYLQNRYKVKKEFIRTVENRESISPTGSYYFWWP